MIIDERNIREAKGYVKMLKLDMEEAARKEDSFRERFLYNMIKDSVEILNILGIDAGIELPER